MNTAMPFAVEERKIEPNSEIAAITITATTSPNPAPMLRSGHQPPLIPVMSTAAR